MNQMSVYVYSVLNATRTGFEVERVFPSFARMSEHASNKMEAYRLTADAVIHEHGLSHQKWRDIRGIVYAQMQEFTMVRPTSVLNLR